MGVLSGALAACSRRRPPDKSAPAVCPISGKEGVCPLSGKATAAAPAKGEEKKETAVETASAEDVAKAAEHKERQPQNGELHAQATAAAPAQGEEKKETAVETAGAEDVAKAAEHKERGNAHFKKGELEEALEAYTEALLLTKRDPTLWLNRSIVHRQLKNWEDARDCAEIAAGLEPSNAKAHYSRAVAQQQLGEMKQALRSCEEGLRAQAENKALLQLRATLKRELAAPGGPEAGKANTPPRQELPVASAVEDTEASPAKCPASKLPERDMQDIKDAADAYQWKGRDPSEEEREGLKQTLVNMFRNKYMELKAASAGHSQKTALSTDQYEKEQKQGLQLKGGHQPMRRPDNVQLPASYREPLGVVSLEKLGRFGADNEERRYILSIYGKLFDVSDRPDKYGPDGPYASLTGKDLTWGLFAGVDTVDYCNRCYDLFKAKDLGKDKMAGVCSWLAWYETEYGEPVGLLEPFTRERELPPPPLEEMDEACVVM